MDIGTFVQDCIDAHEERDPQAAVLEVLTRAVGEPSRAGISVLHHSETLTIDVIHSVTNPLPRFTGGIHIYGGDFFATTRSQWSPETLAEEPSNGDVIEAMFERENARLDL